MFLRFFVYCIVSASLFLSSILAASRPSRMASKSAKIAMKPHVAMENLVTAWPLAQSTLVELKNMLFLGDKWSTIKFYFVNKVRKHVVEVLAGPYPTLMEALHDPYGEVERLLAIKEAPIGAEMTRLLDAVNALDDMLDLVSGDDNNTKAGTCLAAELAGQEKAGQFRIENRADLRAIIEHKVCVKNFVSNVQVAKLEPAILSAHLAIESLTRSVRLHLHNKFHKCHEKLMSYLAGKGWAARIVESAEVMERKVVPILDGKSAKLMPILSVQELDELYLATNQFLLSAFSIDEPNSMLFCIRNVMPEERALSINGY